MIGSYVLVTTEYRGVFFGKLKSEDEDKRIVVIEEAQNCVYWSSDVKGFVGLATNGPTEGCKIGPISGELKLYKVTSVTKASNSAIEKWKGLPWS